ncbi:hypothetical protein [Rufibacter latericius]|uniref:Uncharacterized protein n=1 Tax=Rufibacter latericius TaxID=2487040 RepID=A0A3M9MKJ4_9BACT|nr:hypothetical protein [Rufibacter latericius]RNI26060.1 hypothetical protein EFB08_14640 [Rufibacter latericius]
MDTSIEQAQRKGISYALRATLVTEVVIAVLLFTFLLSATSSVQAFWDLVTYLGAFNVVLFVLSSLLFAFLIGRSTGVKIMQRKREFAWRGVLSGLEVVLLSTIICIVATVLLQATNGSLEKGWLVNFIMKPFAWMAILCLIPVSIAGLWYGYKLKSKLNQE